MAWLFLDKNRSLSLLVINIYKTEQLRFLYSITQCLATFYLEQFSSPSSVKEILDQIHISKWTVQTDSLFSIADYPGHISDKFTILY